MFHHPFIIGAIIWFVFGIFWVRFRGNGWIIMITDRRNSRHTWMAFPTLFMTWWLWPIQEQFSRFMFLLSR